MSHVIKVQQMMSDMRLKRKWSLFCSSVSSYLTADTSHLFLSAGHTARDTEERGGDKEGGHKGGGHRERGNLTTLFTAAVVICVVGLVGFFLWKRQRSQKQNPDPLAAAEAVELETLSSSNHGV